MSVETETEVVESDGTAELLAEMEQIVSREDLRIADRCDRCNAPAFVAVVPIESTAEVDHPGELLLCAHHFRKGEEKLAAFVVKDERERLHVKLGASC